MKKQKDGVATRDVVDQIVSYRVSEALSSFESKMQERMDRTVLDAQNQNAEATPTMEALHAAMKATQEAERAKGELDEKGKEAEALQTRVHELEELASSLGVKTQEAEAALDAKGKEAADLQAELVALGANAEELLGAKTKLAEALQARTRSKTMMMIR